MPAPYRPCPWEWPAVSALLLLAACGSGWPHGTRGFPGGGDADSGLGHTGQAGGDSGIEDTGASGGDWPARYPDDALQSPLTEYVVEGLRAIGEGGSGQQADVFMKVGDSMTVDGNALFCFADDYVDLGEYSDLQTTLDFFLGGDAAGSTPFDRESRAAEEGMSASWATSGTPSPVEQELEALSPSLAVVQYGSNDMEQGTTYRSAIWGFGSNMLDLVDAILAAGVVPVLLTIPPREDVSDAWTWVPSYNAVIRGIAESLQVPLIDLHLGLQEVDGYGLSSDGLHLNAYTEGGFHRACVLTEEALEHGNNTRNLLILQALDRLRSVLVEGESSLDEPGTRPQGEGSSEDPFVIDALPYASLQDTTASPHTHLDVYTGCEADQDESGPEYLYRLDLQRSTAVRLMVFDRGEVDVDLHLLGEEISESSCLERDDAIIERTLEPGTYHLALDTYVSSGVEKSGEYLFVALECEDGDDDCL